MAKRRYIGGLALALTFACALTAQATPPTTAVLGTPPQPAWAALSTKQKMILAPLAKEWNGMENIRRKQWLAIASRYPAMSEKEQERVQKRMRDWVKLTPEQRTKARENYRNINQLPSEQQDLIKKKWSAYKDLPEEEKLDVRESTNQLSFSPRHHHCQYKSRKILSANLLHR
jgi:hypothetical protein